MLQKARPKASGDPRKRLIVAISGASGAIYGRAAAGTPADTEIETHLVVSRTAKVTLATETHFKVADVEVLADVVHSNDDLGAACSSGSFQNLGMIVAPCSIKTMAEIATGVTANLISRSADVALKERRRVVLMLRETPLHLGHIRQMAAVTEAGAIVYPPVPAFYARAEIARRHGRPHARPRCSICSNRSRHGAALERRQAAPEEGAGALGS